MIDKSADFYLDFQRFNALRVDARNGDESAAQNVARQFEGMFVQQMLTAMRAAAQIDPEQHSDYMNFYHEMYDKQLAQSIAGDGQLGVARMILKQIERVDGTGAEETQAPVIAIGAVGEPPATVESPVAEPEMPVAPAAPADTATVATPTTPVAIAAAPVATAFAAPTLRLPGDASTAPATVRLGRVVDNDFAEVAQLQASATSRSEPEEFIASVWPAAQDAAERLGVSPRLLVAQAALESGWGRYTMKFDDGRDSFNLFGIKAGREWQGEVIHQSSLEYEGGVLQPRVSAFRAYRSAEQSFTDYADFISTRPRYGAALAEAGDDRAYIRAVHAAGYATDPDYADKVIGILDGDLLRQGLAQLDNGDRANA